MAYFARVCHSGSACSDFLRLATWQLFRMLINIGCDGNVKVVEFNVVMFWLDVRVVGVILVHAQHRAALAGKLS